MNPLFCVLPIILFLFILFFSMKRGGCLAARNFKGQDFVKFKLSRRYKVFSIKSFSISMIFIIAKLQQWQKKMSESIIICDTSCSKLCIFVSEQEDVHSLQFAVCTSFKIDKIAMSNVLG